MKTKVYCIVSNRGVHSFYLQQDGKRYFLFNQDYHKSVQEYFGRGVVFDKAIKFDKIRKAGALSHTMEKLPSHIKYVEKEYQIAVYKKTKKKKSSRYKHRAWKDECILGDNYKMVV